MNSCYTDKVTCIKCTKHITTVLLRIGDFQRKVLGITSNMKLNWLWGVNIRYSICALWKRC